MLKITISEGDEQWDEINQMFVYPKEQTLQLEHSLVSLSKWESKWCKPFLTKQEKTFEETLDYIRCMTITQNVNLNVYRYLTIADIDAIKQYINSPMTATRFSDDKNAKPNREQVTAEIIYYWMIALNIPFECQKWHLNKLLTLIKVCEIKNSPPKKRGMKDIMRRNTALNEMRKKQLHTKG